MPVGLVFTCRNPPPALWSILHRAGAGSAGTLQQSPVSVLYTLLSLSPMRPTASVVWALLEESSGGAVAKVRSVEDLQE